MRRSLTALITTVAAVLLVSIGIASPASAADGQYSWDMSPSSMTFSGPGVNFVPSPNGTAVEFNAATSYGVVPNSEGFNPELSDFAMGVTFTSDPISGSGVTPNFMQKGLANKQGQIKISGSAYNNGMTLCRIKGSNGYQVLKNKLVEIDDGNWHTASCWHEASTIGLTVDGKTVTMAFEPGSVVTDQPVRVGNKLATADATDQHFGMNDWSGLVMGPGARETLEQLRAAQ